MTPSVLENKVFCIGSLNDMGRPGKTNFFSDLKYISGVKDV